MRESGPTRLIAYCGDCKCAHSVVTGADRWFYVDTSKHVGDKDHLKVFANEDAAETWFQESDPEGVAFEYEVLE